MNEIGDFEIFLHLWWNVLISAIILFTDNNFEVRFWAHHYVSNSSFVHAQSITLRMNMLSEILAYTKDIGRISYNVAFQNDCHCAKIPKWAES